MASPFAPDTTLPCTVSPSPNHGDRRGRAIDTLVLHYTGMPTADAALARLCDPAAEVSSHYLVDEAGVLFQLVQEERRAWHAGRSFWQGERDLNSVSIGIEIANAGHDGGLPPFPKKQIDAVIALCRDIMERRGIGSARVLAHSDIAPGRKIDPGERFPWKTLAGAGVGTWPVGGAPLNDTLSLGLGARGSTVAALQRNLGARGADVPASGHYDLTTKHAIVAFQQRYRPGNCKGVADDDTRSLIDIVVKLQRFVADAPKSS